MTSPRLPGPRQPYHALESTPVAKAGPLLDRYLANATALAAERLAALLDKLAARGCRVRAAAILDSHGRRGADLAAILASHALIHTADGDHFRAALAGACERLGIAAGRVRKGDLDARAAGALGRPAPELRAEVAALKKKVGPPWGADQKAAALLAWLALAETAR